jgi:subtilisin family serine protease
LRASGEVVGPALTLTHRRRLALGAHLVAPSRMLSGKEARATVARLAALPGVEYVEPNAIVSTTLTPNDAWYLNQWQYWNPNAGIRADRAWDTSTGNGIVVGVLDTGLVNHTDLNANTAAGWDMLSDPLVARDGNGRDSVPFDQGNWSDTSCPNGRPPQRSDWHGTHVAGSIVAVGNNAAGVIGTAHSARALPVRVLGHCGGPVSDIADGIVWASGGSVIGAPVLPSHSVASVLNLSLGGRFACGPTFQAAIDFARSRGVSVVVSAGNENSNVSTQAPANCSGVISVAATDIAGNRAGFSNFGAGITLSAPGVNILSTSNNGQTTPAGQEYLLLSGTSMAAPHVTGVVALVQSRRNALSMAPMFPDDIKILLQRSADRTVGNCPGGCGSGIVNAEAAVVSAATAAPRLFAAGTLSMPAGTLIDAVSMKIAYQTDGNMVIYRQDWTPLWASNTSGLACSPSNCSGAFQSDGNLVLYQNGVPYWATNTVVPGAALMFSSVAPHVVIYGTDGTLRYSSSPLVGVIAGTFTLRPQMSTQFAGGRIAYGMDGNLAVYDSFGTPLWSTNTQPLTCAVSTCVAAFQSDGNLVLYFNGVPHFATGTVGARSLLVQATEPFLQILGNNNNVVWPLYGSEW